MNPPENLVCSLGHVATVTELLGRGATPAQIRASVRSGALTRGPRGVYLCGHADSDQRDAVAARARIACLSVLRRSRVWTGLDRSLHLQLPPHARGDRPAVDHAGRRIHYHWAPPKFVDGTERSWLASPMDAVWQAIHCLDEENAIACLESAVHEDFLTVQQVRRLCAHAPQRLQRGIREMEFTAGAGIETIARRRLRHAGYSVVAQVQVQGVGDQDLVVEDCVALETDGEKWHGPNRFHADRDRDLIVEGLGRRALRLTHKHVMFEWESTLLTIARVVADAKREQSRRFGGRTLIRFDDPL